MAVDRIVRRAALLVVLLLFALSRPLDANLSFGAPTFAPTGIGPSAIAVADFNGDGSPDFATVNLDQTVSVSFGDGTGAFPTSATYTGFSATESVAAIIAADLNQDGHPDLIVANAPSFDSSLSNTLAVLLNNGAGTFAAQPLVTLTASATGLAAGDFNQDGKIDVLAASAFGPDALTFLPGDGAGGFGAQTHPALSVGQTAFKLTAADFNGDGRLDAAITAGDGVDWIFGNGDGTFSAPTVMTLVSPDGASAIAAADIDHDGDIDLATAGGNVVAGASVYLNDGSGAFSRTQFSMPQAPANPVELALADLDNDGNVDIVTADTNGCPPWGSNLAARPGHGDGTFGAAIAISVGYTNCVNSWYNPVAVAAADLNCDGVNDLLAPLQNSTSAFHNVAVILSPGGGGSCGDAIPPVIHAPADITVEAGPLCVRHLSDTDIGTATATDNSGSVTVSKSGVPAGNDFPLGTTTITWTATDGSGNTATATQTVTVTAPPPVIASASASTPVLWPANHKMVDETIDYTVTGACGAVSCVIDSVTSSEPANGSGDGDTAPDWEIVDAHHVRLRAERAGSGPGRIYTIHITCTDTHGHSTSSAVTVTVPHNK